MSDTLGFGVLVVGAAGATLLAVQSSTLLARLRVPAPAVFLAVAAVAAGVPQGLPAPDHRSVERAVTLALVVILFDGGLRIGVRRLRPAARPVLGLGVLGTLATAAVTCVLVHLCTGVSWYASVLTATALAPTDPAVVFSVFGARELEGRSATVLEGEAGANDPVAIALMTALVAAGSLSGSAAGQVAVVFVGQMVVGTAAGVAGAKLLAVLCRRVVLPVEGLHPIRVLAGIAVLYGATTLARGSGLLAVFVAGLVLGDQQIPFQRQIQRFHAALSGVAEILAFLILGTTVDLEVLARPGVWGPGLAVGIGVAVLVRPAVGLPLLWRTSLARNERTFILLAGLKGAVPLLLGGLLLPLPNGQRLYGIVVVATVVSVVGQGSLVSPLARWLRLGMRSVESRPHAVELRVRHQPAGAHHLVVARGAPADGSTLGELPDLGAGTWIAGIVRDGRLVPVRDHTRLRPGDEVTILLDAGQPAGTAARLFTRTDREPG